MYAQNEKDLTDNLAPASCVPMEHVMNVPECKCTERQGQLQCLRVWYTSTTLLAPQCTFDSRPRTLVMNMPG